jgi:cbb3-type cytochrome oxidase subunit 3
MKSTLQHFANQFAILVAITILLLYILWIQFFPRRNKVKQAGRKNMQSYYSKLPDWNLY